MPCVLPGLILVPGFTVHIIFINFDNHSPDFGRETCLAPEGFKRSFSGPWPKKVVHHWSRPRPIDDITLTSNVRFCSTLHAIIS